MLNLTENPDSDRWLPTAEREHGRQKLDGSMLLVVSSGECGSVWKDYT